MRMGHLEFLFPGPLGGTPTRGGGSSQSIAHGLSGLQE